MFLLRRAKVMSWCKNKDRERGKRYDDERTIVIRGDTHNRHHHHHHLCFWSRGYCLIYILWKKMGEKKMFSTFFFHHQRRNENFSGYILNAKAVCQQHTHTHTQFRHATNQIHIHILWYESGNIQKKRPLDESVQSSYDLEQSFTWHCYFFRNCN